MYCKHEHTYKENCFIICIECGIMFKSYPIIFPQGKSYKNRRVESYKHSTRKYFEKFIKNLDLNVDLDRLFEDFDKQEKVLKKVLKTEGRRNSLNVQYKLHKLLSRQGVFCPEVKLPKCSKTLIEHDRIMNLVWEELNWKNNYS